jgi:MFS family permease
VKASETRPSEDAARAASSPAGERVADLASSQARTLYVGALGTLLVLAVFSAFVITAGDSARALGAGIGGEAWSLSAMSLGLAAALLTAGALADDVGHWQVLRWTAGLLAIASAVGALAPNIAVLVAARVLQGVAGGGVLASSLGSIGHAFPVGPARTRAPACGEPRWALASRRVRSQALGWQQRSGGGADSGSRQRLLRL